ncbi:hypothetical protein [Giesbergeria anulus]|uniref:Uncharacterized protein n=1 Tax=Giesbergeria anulus TaxID=180197 RepID=A0A1H9E848_9BURK|nr:hypothetical protein [Giesbergeria anulus]SEQ21861.1 hypothetical protein SAMN02982919_00226 [Giesbergeria anulus]
MFYTANPEIDAARHDDYLERQQNASAYAYEQVAAQIRSTFTEGVTVQPLHTLKVPTLRWDGEVMQMSAIEAIDDSLTYTGPHDALMEVMAKSACPLVATLRAMLAKHWIEMYAEKIVGAGYETAH